jgi:hypothetical protein
MGGERVEGLLQRESAKKEGDQRGTQQARGKN